MNRRTALSLLLGILISGLGLYLAFRNVPFNELFHYIGAINYIWVIPASAVILLSFILRVVRWRIILTSSHAISFPDAFHPLMIGYMMNCILPGRVGEIARPLIIQRRNRIPFGTGVSTVAVERVFDMVVLLGLFAWLLADVDIAAVDGMAFGNLRLDKATLDGIAFGALQITVILITGIILVSIPRFRRMLIRGIQALPALAFFLGPEKKQAFRDNVCLALVGFVEHVAAGFSLIRYPVKIMACGALSVILWVLMAYSYLLVARGCPGIDVSFVDIFVVMIIICFFIALPSVPGFWGLWEAGGVFALSLFGVDTKDAAGYTLVNHAVQMFPVIFTGMASALVISVNIRQIAGKRR